MQYLEPGTVAGTVCIVALFGKFQLGDNCIVFENFTASIIDLMIANIRLLAPLSRRQ